AQEVADIRDSMKGVTLPGILVLGTNGSPVLSESLTSLTAGTDFGAMTNGTTAVHTLTVTNTGENTLTLSAAALSGDGASAFTVSALAGDIEEGGTTNFTVQFTAAASQCYQATLLITNNAAQSYELALSGRGFTVTPNDGPAVGGTSITVESDPLGGDITNVLVGGKSAVFSNQTAGSVAVMTPSGNGAQDIVIQSPSLGDITLPNAYLYHPTGYIISVDPATCTETGGVPVQVIGTNLCANADDIVSVSLCGVAATVNGLGEGDNNSQAIQITAGAGGAGIGNVVVVSTRYGTSILSNGFTYLTRPSAPVMLPATDMAATSFTANWNPAAHATGYVFEAAWDESFTNIVSGYSNRWNGALTSVAVTNLLEQYSNVYVRARGVNAIGTGSWSSVQTVLLRSTFTNVAGGLDMSIINMTTNYQQGLVYVDYLFSNNAASHNVLAEPFWFSAPSNSLYYLAKPDGTAPDGNPYVNCTAQFDAKLGGQAMNPGDAVTVTNIPFYFFTLQRQQVDGTLWASQREAWSAPVAADLTIRVIPGTNYTGQLTITGDARTPLTYAVLAPATNGNAVITGETDGQFTYYGPTNRGRDTFTFTVSNIDGSSTGTVRVIIQKNSGLPWLQLLLGE
ncbi:MAG: choice-of-anchor D domain-containing protein, partial [Spartobacteria bacterium]|nr:choice-of-anchor D domain-containing protein [Spartobacteria bacterium]